MAVPSEITRGVAFDGADAVLDSLADHPLEEIVRLVGERVAG